MPPTTRSQTKAADAAGPTMVAGSAGWLFPPEIDALIMKHMSLEDKRSFRLVSRATKAAVDATVTKACSPCDFYYQAYLLSPDWKLRHLSLKKDYLSITEFRSKYLALQPLECLTSLAVDWRLRASHIQMLQNAPWLSQLETLRVRVKHEDDEDEFLDMRVLLRSCISLKSLTISLAVSGGPHAWCVHTGCMPNLRTLNLDGGFSPRQAQQLCQAGFPQLEELTFGHSSFGEEGAAWLAQAKWNLHTLTLHDFEFWTPAGEAAFTRAPWFRGLRRLTWFLSGSNLTTPMASQMAQQLACVRFDRLERLDLRTRSVLDVTAMRAFVRGRFDHLEHLGLPWCGLTCASVEVLVSAARAFPQLRELCLNGNHGVGAGGLAAIANQKFDKLEVVSHSPCRYIRF